MEIHAIALGKQNNVEELDETCCVTHQKIRCSGEWIKVESYKYNAKRPMIFLKEETQNTDFKCEACLDYVKLDLIKVIEIGRHVINTNSDYKSENTQENETKILLFGYAILNENATYEMNKIFR